MTDLPAKNRIPRRTDLERNEALVLANQVRTARRLLKEQLKQGEVSLASLVAECPAFLATAKVSELLQAAPGRGPIKAGSILASCGISATKTMAGLSPRQRQSLLETLST